MFFQHNRIKLKAKSRQRAEKLPNNTCEQSTGQKKKKHKSYRKLKNILN